MSECALATVEVAGLRSAGTVAHNDSETLVGRIRSQKYGSVEWPTASLLLPALRTPLAVGLKLAQLPERALSAAVDQARAENGPDVLWLLASTACGVPKVGAAL
jgi:hypothetical protein